MWVVYFWSVGSRNWSVFCQPFEKEKVFSCNLIRRKNELAC